MAAVKTEVVSHHIPQLSLEEEEEPTFQKNFVPLVCRTINDVEDAISEAQSKRKDWPKLPATVSLKPIYIKGLTNQLIEELLPFLDEKEDATEIDELSTFWNNNISLLKNPNPIESVKSKISLILKRTTLFSFKVTLHSKRNLKRIVDSIRIPQHFEGFFDHYLTWIPTETNEFRSRSNEKYKIYKFEEEKIVKHDNHFKIVKNDLTVFASIIFCLVIKNRNIFPLFSKELESVLNANITTEEKIKVSKKLFKMFFVTLEIIEKEDFLTLRGLQILPPCLKDFWDEYERYRDHIMKNGRENAELNVDV